MTYAEARSARAEGLRRVEAGTDPAWAIAAWNFLMDYIETHETVFCDDLWEAGLPIPRELRALGPIFTRAARLGLITKTNQFKKSVRSHLGTKAIWQVNIQRSTS